MSSMTLIVVLVVAIVVAWLVCIVLNQVRVIRHLRRRVRVLQSTINLMDAAEVIRSMQRHPSQRGTHWPLRESETEE